MDPIRLARATTHRKRDGKNCGCNECFGLCNSPGLSKIAVRQKGSDSLAIIFLGETLPTNFEKEFGIDEEVTLNASDSSKTYKLKTGVYNAVRQSGQINLDGHVKSYSGGVIVGLKE